METKSFALSDLFTDFKKHHMLDITVLVDMQLFWFTMIRNFLSSLAGQLN